MSEQVKSGLGLMSVLELPSALASTEQIPKSQQLRPLKNIDPKDVLDRYLAGETGPQIAQSLGVTKQALSYWLIEKAETEWKSAQVVKALHRKEDAEQLMDRASNPLDLARAREQLRGAQWDLERVCRRIYGQDSPPAGAAQVAIQINLRRSGATSAVQQDEIIVGTVPNTAQSTD